MDSCININKLTDTSLRPEERACVDDEKNCVVIPLSGNVLSSQLEKLCGCLSAHINLASQHRFVVQRMVANFRIDEEDRVWLLWVEDMVIDDELNPRKYVMRELVVCVITEYFSLFG